MSYEGKKVITICVNHNRNVTTHSNSKVQMFSPNSETALLKFALSGAQTHDPSESTASEALVLTCNTSALYNYFIKVNRTMFFRVTFSQTFVIVF